MNEASRSTLGAVSLIGCGYVADLYMRSLARHPEISVTGAWDRDPARLAAFCTHWGVAPYPSAAALFARGSLVLNLTNPTEHATVTRAALEAGAHVFSEKPMVTDLAEARALAALAEARGLQLASAPSSVLSRTAQGLFRALRQGVAGTPRLVYAELDDGFIPQAPLEAWASESGAPWPFADEFATGCTLEHAGYWLSWLIAAFGSVTRVDAATAEVIPDKRGHSGTPDLSTALIHFEAGPVARLTCSIVAPHDHRLRVIGEAGVLEVPRAWDNAAPVRFRRRMTLRRRLLESPLPRSVGLSGAPHPMLPRQGAASMNFALGPAEMLEAIAAGRPSRLSGAYALHLTEVTLAIAAGARTEIASRCPPMEPMPWAA
ncbi:Gfo/Idh/MocA family protein [Pseudoroseicyclus sp. CXY001]|uniref:Gfo/Idh/MocA family protein n=1 Tax=Pseudoroseicyclus sp. CXY001 TaxID=3242492 RepID=UPI003571712A